MTTETKDTKTVDTKLVKLFIKYSQSDRAKADKIATQLFEKYKPHMTYVMNQKLGNREDVEDILLITFSKAFDKIRLYDCESGAFSTWLYNIMHNTYVDFLKTRKEKVMSIDTVTVNGEGESVVHELQGLEDNVEDQITKSEVMEALKKAIENIPNKDILEVIQMRFFKEMSYEAIAEATGKPMGTVKANVYRAKEYLRKVMSKYPIFC